MNYQVYEFQTILEEYIKSKGTPHLFVRVVGPNKCNDVEKLNKVYDTYRYILPPDVFHGIFYNEMFIMEFEYIEEAERFLADSFPDSPVHGDPDYYIYGAVYNGNGEILFSNDFVEPESTEE